MNEFPTMVIALIRYNLSLTLCAIAIALPIACLCALARLSPARMISYPVTVYVNTLRSMPLVLVMFWVYMIIPMLSGRSISAYWAALIALACFEIAYLTEIVRSGIQSISANQWSASVATGLSRWQAARHIVIPQALRSMTPALLTQSLIAFQDSTISSIIGVPEILQATAVINARQQNPTMLYAALAATFFVICYGCSVAVRFLETKNTLRMQR